MIHPAGWITACAVVLGFLCLLHPLALKIRRRDQSPQPYGIQVVSDPPNAKFEIVAVHGLGAHPEYTWIRRVNNQKANTIPQEVHLLRDLLPETFTEARILSFADNTSWLINAPVKTARDIGKDLLDQLKKHRRSQRGPRLPICFIGHSFGGIIIKEALCMPAIRDEIVQDTSGVLFLGTPHQGSSLSLIGSFAAWLTSFLGSGADLPLSLRQDSPELRNLAGTFESRFKERRDVKIYSICETMPTKVFGISVVTHNSAKYPGSVTALVNTDHSGLNKCYGCKDQAYVKIKEAIIDMRCLSLLDWADKDIRNSYDVEKLKIERLSSQRLPMGQCYINLALVEQNQRKDPRKDSTQPPALHPTLLERMNIKESSSENQFDLQTLFQPRKIRQEKEDRSPRRILIRGRPGVGKTTLCKKIVHDFVHDHQWNEHFKRLLWIPLRNLTQRSAPHTLKTLLHDEFFAQSSERDSESKLEELFRQCNSPDDTDSLFLLDGLDEIWHGLSTDSDLYRFVQHLLNRPNVITTTRPSVQFAERVNAFDLELETVGFYSTQVKQYVQNVEPLNARSILGFLDEHSLVADLVRIPIQLDALCFAWRDKSAVKRDGLARPETMTDLYQAIERGIWKKDAVALGKIKQQQTPFWTELEHHLEEEVLLLEKLAFTGMHNKTTIFDTGFIRKLLHHLPSPTLMIDSTLQSLSLLRASGVSPFDMDRTYYFLHLTLQEYFAARYIRRQWIKGDKGNLVVLDLESETCEALRPVTFFQRHKYDEHYDIIWRFLAGLLNFDTESQVRLFEAIQSQPLDVLGPAHQRLVMRCLFETRHNFPLRKRLEYQLSAWLDFEYELSQQDSGKKRIYRSLAEAMEFPVDVLVRRMSSDEKLGRYLVQTIKPRRGVHNSFVEAVIKHLRKSTDTEVLLAALSFFDCFSDGELPRAWMQEVVEKLEHSDASIRLAAMEILLKQPSLQIGTSEAVVQRRLEDKDPDVCEAAIRVLGNQSDISEAVLQALAKKLGEENWDVRQAAIKVFQDRPSLSVSLLSTIVCKLESNNPDIQEAANRVVEKQLSLPKEVLESIIQKLKTNDSDFRQAAIRILRNQANLLESLLCTLVGMLTNDDSIVQEAAIQVLGRQPSLTEPVRRLIVENLKDEDGKIRWAALEILGDKPDPSETVLQKVVLMFEDHNAKVRTCAVNLIRYQPSLPEAVLKIVFRMLEDKNAHVRVCAAQALQNQPSIPEAVLEIAAHLVRDEDIDVRWAATLLLQNQPDLPVAVFELVTSFLQFESCQLHALKIFENQPSLSGTVLEIAACLCRGKGGCVGWAAAQLLSKQSDLPVAVLKLATSLLEEDEYCRSNAITFLKEQPSLPEAVLELAIYWLKHEETFVRRNAIGLLENKSNLSDKVLETVARLVEDEDEESYIRDEAARLLRNQRSLPKAVLDIATRLLQNCDGDIRLFAVRLLYNQSSLSEAVLKAVTELFVDENIASHVRRNASEILFNQPNLPEHVLLKILQILSGDHWSWFQDDAESILNNQPTLSLAVLHKVVHIVRYGRDIPQRHALIILKTQPSLPEAILESLAQSIGCSLFNYNTSGVIEVFEKQRHLSEAVLQVIANKLESESSIVCRAGLCVLRERPSLSKTVLETVVKCLPSICSLDLDEELFRVLICNPKLIHISQSIGSFEALFKSLLRQSFNVHCVWYYDDQTHFLNSGGVIVELSDLVSTCAIDQVVQDCSLPTVAVAL